MSLNHLNISPVANGYVVTAFLTSQTYIAETVEQVLKIVADVLQGAIPVKAEELKEV